MNKKLYIRDNPFDKIKKKTNTVGYIMNYGFDNDVKPISEYHDKASNYLLQFSGMIIAIMLILVFLFWFYLKDYDDTAKENGNHTEAYFEDIEKSRPN